MAIKGHQRSNLRWHYIKNTCHEEYYLCGKFHAFMKTCMFYEKVHDLTNFGGNTAIVEPVNQDT